jgi:rare lipoprotein A
MPTCRPLTRLGILLLLGAALTLGACSSKRSSGGYFEDDGPGREPPDVANTADAVPKSEPRSRSGNKPYQVFGQQYVPLADATGYKERGVASWYGKKFHGRPTSSGEPYDMYAMTAAHRTLPLPTYVRVSNLENGRSIVVRVNDRGPFLHNRLIDLSYAAASKLGIVGRGTGVVELETILPGGETPAQVVVAPTPPATEIRGLGAPAAIDVAALPPAGASAPVKLAAPKLFVQVGSFREWNNAEGLRTRLERAAFRPIAVQSVLLDNQDRVYRVRIGPIAGVEEGDRITEALGQQGVTNALIVVE